MACTPEPGKVQNHAGFSGTVRDVSDRFARFSVVAVLAASCAAQTIDPYAPTLDYRGVGSIAIGVLDRRKEVMSGLQPPSQVGIYAGRSGDVLFTDHGLPLAHEFETALAHGLMYAGFRASRLMLDPSEDAISLISLMKTTSVSRALVVDINEWKVVQTDFSFQAEYALVFRI